MRTTLAIGLAAGLVIAAATAGEAHAQAQAQAKPDRATEAAKHFAVANAGLESAEANAEMLYEITAKPALYDQAHGQLFVKNIKEAITYAQGHIAHIEPLVQSEQEKKQLQMLNERVSKASSMVSQMESNVANVEQLHKDAGAMDKQLDGSMEPLEKLAKDMKVPVDVG